MCRSTSEASPESSASHEHTSDQRSPSAGTHPTSDAKEKERRVPLACLRCRAKRARCSGTHPRCKSCENADVDCQWPEGRRRKRTRKEMEEAERLEREVAAAAVAATSERGRTSIASEQASLFTSQHHQDGRVSMPWMRNTFMAQGPTGSEALRSPSTSQWQYPVPPVNPAYVWPPQDPSSSTSAIAAGLTPASSDDTSDLLAATGVSPTSSEQLMRALESHTAFVEGDPDSREDLELYYYRLAGSTAIHPGINRISLKLQARPPIALSAPVPSDQRGLTAPPWPDELFDENSMPLPSVHLPLLDTFFRTMSQHFPSISRRRFNERLETGTMSAFLLNCACAVAARFHPGTEGRAAAASAPFITKAQELIVPLLHLPAHDTVTGLLLLAWACYGQNSEAALWQYSGMAFRMSFDLGLHEISELYESRGHVVRTRLLFWSLFITDRIISFSTGRPASIPEDVIEIALPSDEDFFPDPARNTDPSLHEPVEPVPFQYLVRAMVLIGRISAALNGQRGRPRTLVGSNEISPEVLSGLQTQLVQFHAGLPETMRWSVENFKRQEARGHGGSYLTLHLWTNAVMALVYHPELTSSPSGMHSPITQSMHRSMRLSLASSRNISECLVFADLFSSGAYLGSPFSVQPIFVACLAFLYEIKRNAVVQGSQPSGVLPTEANEPPSAEQFMSSMARQNLTILTKALQRMEQYWAGIAYVLNILEQRVTGLGLPRIDASTEAIKTFISLPDKGMLRRYTGRDLPHDTAPATDTSLRESIEKEEKERTAASSSFSVEDLLSSYSVESLFVSPASDYDLQHLLDSGSGWQ